MITEYDTDKINQLVREIENLYRKEDNPFIMTILTILLARYLKVVMRDEKLREQFLVIFNQQLRNTIDSIDIIEK